jgi:hypothetical protein
MQVSDYDNRTCATVRIRKGYLFGRYILSAIIEYLSIFSLFRSLSEIKFAQSEPGTVESKLNGTFYYRFHLYAHHTPSSLIPPSATSPKKVKIRCKRDVAQYYSQRKEAERKQNIFKRRRTTWERDIHYNVTQLAEKCIR